MRAPYVHIPKEIDGPIEDLLDLIDAEFDAVQVDVRIWNESRPLDCFENIRRRIKKNGGTMQMGWLIIKTEIVFEANAHAVWVNNSGQWLDITPQQLWQSDKVLFVPDDRLKYDGHVIPNVRMDHTGDETVKLYVELMNFYDKIRSLTWYEDGSDVIYYPSDLVKATEAKYEKYIPNFQMIVMFQAKDEAPCFCGNGKSFGECHKVTLRAEIVADGKTLNLE